MALAIACSFALACGDDDDPTDVSGDPGLTIVSGAGQADTIEATLAEPLVVEVRDADGRPVSSTPVHFDVIESGSGPMMRSISENGPFTTQVVDETTARGRAGVEILLGSEAGEHRIAIDVPELDYSDTVAVTTAPGDVVVYIVAPIDTARLRGSTFTIPFYTVDRFTNVVDGGPIASVDFEVLSGPVTVTDAGVVTAGNQYGRGEILVTTPTFERTAVVTVVPEGTLYATRHSEPNSPGLVGFRTDGEDFVILDDSASEWLELNPTASPEEDAVVFQRTTGETQIVAYGPGAYQPLAPAATVPQLWPQFTGDGSAVVFATGFGEESAIRSVPATGGAATLVLETPFVEVVAPSLSPSGHRVAFVDRISSQLAIADLAGDSININGVTIAKFSPVEDRVAMIRNGDLWIVGGDGAGLELVVEAADVWEGVPFTPRNLAWSPDGEWVVVNQAPDQGFPWTGPLVLIEIDTGLALPLTFRMNVSQATWGP